MRNRRNGKENKSDKIKECLKNRIESRKSKDEYEGREIGDENKGCAEKNIGDTNKGCVEMEKSIREKIKPDIKHDEEKEEKNDRNKRDIYDFGCTNMEENSLHREIQLLTIIGEIEGHENLSASSKTTKYEHVLPMLANIEGDDQVKGILVLLNTMGGDVEAGLAIAEMLSSLSKPTVSLVLGGSHSIGGPIAVSCDYSFIVPTGTMVIHPVRLTGTVIGAKQTYDYFKCIQDRIVGFICEHCSISKERLEKLMNASQMLTKDIGTILVGKEAVKEGIIDEVGGIHAAMQKLNSLIKEKKEL